MQYLFKKSVYSISRVLVSTHHPIKISLSFDKNAPLLEHFSSNMTVFIRGRQWDVLLGGDLGWSAAREFALTRGLEQMCL